MCCAYAERHDALRNVRETWNACIIWLRRLVEYTLFVTPKCHFSFSHIYGIRKFMGNTHKLLQLVACDDYDSFGAKS